MDNSLNRQTRWSRPAAVVLPNDSSTVVEHSTTDPEIKGLNLSATAKHLGKPEK